MPPFPTKLVNIDEDLPTTFFVFANMLNVITWHNLSFTKGFSSSALGEAIVSQQLLNKYLKGTLDYLQFVPNQKRDLKNISVFEMNSTSNYRIEYNCELYRRVHDQTKLCPSRMSCIYAFGDYDSCKAVSEKYGWDIGSVKQFKLVPLPGTRVAKVNMEVISLFRTLEPVASWTEEEQVQIWEHYWSAKDNIVLEYPELRGQRTSMPSGVIWEYLIEGRLELASD